MKLYEEDIGSLIVSLFDKIESWGIVLTEVQENELISVVETELDKFSEGYRNYN